MIFGWIVSAGSSRIRIPQTGDNRPYGVPNDVDGESGVKNVGKIHVYGNPASVTAFVGQMKVNNNGPDTKFKY